jgi:plasmid stabilization system protein ParE
VTRHIFRPAAAADLEAIHGWYERERRGLGDEFLAEARRVVDTVVALPNGYPVIHRDTRRALVRRFPYGLLYRVVDVLIVFVGCFHTSRDPVSLKRRK